MAQIDSDSEREESETESNPLHFIAQSKLAELTHLDLSDRVTFKEKKVVAGGAYGDISTDHCNFAGRGKVKVAIKRLRFYLKEDIKLLFEKEIYVWSKLKHSNVLALLGYAFDKSGYPLLVSEWMRGGSAWTYVNSHADFDLIHLVIGIARGLTYLHENGVVHSDIKADNILVSDSGDALICDFGCSRMIAASRSLANLDSETRGTSRYLAYELFAPGEGHTMETDVWAFGMTIFELSTRQRPYTGLSDVQVMREILKFEVPSFPSVLPLDLGPEAVAVVKDICIACWNQDPSRRPIMSHTLDALEKAAEQQIFRRPTPSVQHGDRDADPSNVIRRRINFKEISTAFIRSEILAKFRHLELPADSVHREAIASVGGGFGDIFKGSCFLPLRGEVKVAIKLLRFYLKEDIKKLFEQEISVWSKFDHPNVLPLLGYYREETGYPAFVSEWMDNGSAWSYVSSHPDCNLMHLVAGVAEGLAYLHEEGVIHSNIKPDNIVITESGDARICGFTTSRFVDGSMNITGSNDEMRGTVRYLAYELVAPSDSDTSHTKASDVWAFGMTIFAFLTQSHPYAGLSDVQAIVAIMKRELPSLLPSSASSRRPEERILWNICRLCWDHDPEKRADMPSILRELRNHSDDTDVSRLVGDRDADL